MKFKQVLFTIVISAVTAVGAMYGYNTYFGAKTVTIQQDGVKIPVNYAGLFDGNNLPGPVDFEQPAKIAVPAVVHITTVIGKSQASNNLPRRSNPFQGLVPDDFFDDFFGGPQMRSVPQRASGSGVIVSQDGYIITNNHVIDGASEIKVGLSDKRSFTAKLVGADPSSDLAVLKIDATNLPFLLYGNSDNVQIGQWVLAIGYPLNLETTVTAGIISAKGRTLGLNARRSQTPIESFIQTDAAVNQGNSGGALVNTNGELIGINSAIASPTGSYAGYSYAIPVNITKKIVNDLIQFGTVQRAYLGISYLPDEAPDSEKEKVGYKRGQGVYVRETTKDGAAAAAGIKSGDYISKINGEKISSGNEMVEKIARLKPGDKINVTYQRDGKERTTDIILKNKSGNFDIVKISVLDDFGAEFQELDKKRASEFGQTGGVVVKKINANGYIDAQTRMKDGFIILKVNGKAVANVDEFSTEVQKSNNLKFEGFYPGYEGLYTYNISKDSQ
ncbi:MAG: trypsin-like peptidase domain-containing protein [Chitinophagaceae bacterium]|nr:trypsin-like peptidase domain-containing protein [Chitinophagaceae bacterium]MCW5927422.1 trypsin-like peptidase domain-containing protein [Chitinophagaceae bacterium]